MKLCKGVKRKKTDHTPIVYDETEYGAGLCPLCTFIEIATDDAKTIIEMHEKALGQEDYIAALEVDNTKLREGAMLDPTKPAMFTSTITYTTVKPTKKRTKKSAKKKTTKQTNKIDQIEI